MPCRIYLRHDQSLLQRHLFSTNLVTIFAPVWVKEGLKTLGQHLNGVKFDIYESHRDAKDGPVESFTITDDFNQHSLSTLQKIARNEEHNVTGIINKTLYEDIKDRRIIYSMRDLVRQCIIVGVDTYSKCGGYRCPMERQNQSRVYLCDLAALQFQQPYNTGRLVLVQESEPHTGILDDFIYENVVGEQRQTFEEVLDKWENGDVTTKKRYLRHDGFGRMPGSGSCFIDTIAYRSFVKMDVILSGIAIAKTVATHHPEDKINFKFLKYGTGFFAGRFAYELDRLILSGVLDGLEQLFMKTEVINAIKCVELPFYECDPKSAERIEALVSRYGIHVVFGNNDALKESTIPNLIVATTNCGDNHTVCGNEMRFRSVDAAIAENLDSKGNIFSANINQSITEEYIDISI